MFPRIWAGLLAATILFPIASLTTADFWTYGSAGLILLAAVGESIGEFTRWVKPERRNERLKKVSALILMVGLTGDLIAIHVTNLYTASLNKEAADARKVAGLADERAAKATEQTQKLRERADTLELQMADRHITVEQRKKMTEILAPHSGAKIAIGYLTDSGADSHKYSLELGDVFCDAKWIVFQPPLVSNFASIRGFLLEIQENSPSGKRLSDVVRTALAVTGYQVVQQKPIQGFTSVVGGVDSLCRPETSTPTWKPTAVEVLIGSK